MMKFYESAHSFVQSHAHIPLTMKYKIYQDLYQLTRTHPSLTSTPNPPPPLVVYPTLHLLLEFPFSVI